MYTTRARLGLVLINSVQHPLLTLLLRIMQSRPQASKHPLKWRSSHYCTELVFFCTQRLSEVSYNSAPTCIMVVVLAFTTAAAGAAPTPWESTARIPKMTHSVDPMEAAGPRTRRAYSCGLDILQGGDGARREDGR